ncbi:MAG: M56 family metallopeptidase [Sphingobacteriaceae bacterium]|nr:M56 family metallopeptidase [Sphingobacteriaceae bacterium]
MITLGLSFIIPCITLPAENIPVQPVFHQITDQPVDYGSNDPTITIMAEAPESGTPINWDQKLHAFYLLATALLMLHFVVSLVIFFLRLRNQQIEKIGKIRLVKSSSGVSNGSFLNYIFLSDTTISKLEAEQILAHEIEHVKRYHSIDKLFARAVQIVLWFNPFSYFYSKAIEENHEFEVDRAISQNADKQLYAELIFKLSTGTNGEFFNHFSKFPLRTRLNMLFAKPSNKIKKLIYLLVLPLTVASLLAFAGREALKSIKPAVVHPLDSSQVNYEQFLKRNPSVKHLGWSIDGKRMGVHLKNGKSEMYKLNDSKDLEKLKSKYGNLPEAPPPPQTPPVKAPTTSLVPLEKGVGNSLSVVDGLEKLGRNPLVEIDGKTYDNSILYKISRSCIQGNTVYSVAGAFEKFGEVGKDGAVVIKTKEGVLTYLSPLDIENLKAERAVPGSRVYGTYPIKKTDGSLGYGVRIKFPSGGSMSATVNDLSKVGHMIDGKLYEKEEFIQIITKLGRSGKGAFGVGLDKNHPQRAGFETVLWFHTKEFDGLRTGYKPTRTQPKSKIEGLLFNASDSVKFTGDHRFIHLYGRTFITYQMSTTISADYVMIDTEEQTLIASAEEGKKVRFSTDAGMVLADTVKYNIRTKKEKLFRDNREIN